MSVTRGAKTTTLGDLRSVSWPKAAGVETLYQQRRAPENINFLHTTNAATTATPQVPEIRLQGPRRGVDSGTLRPTRSPVGHLSGGELRMEGFSAEPPGLAQHPWQRQQGEKGMLSTRFLLVKPATAKPPSFPSTRLFDRRISKLPDRDVGQLQAPHARCTCRAPKDPSTHIPRCSWQLHRNSVRQSSLSMGAWARTCRSLPEKHLPSRPTTDESGSGLHPDNAAASPDFIS